MIDALQQKNPHITIHPVTEDTFREYGKIIKAFNFTESIEVMSRREIPSEGNIYVGCDEEMMQTAEAPLLQEHFMRQGYINVEPTVRIREEALRGGETSWIVCFKSRGGLARQEIEIAVRKEEFDQLEDLIGLPLIPKTRRTYLLPDGQRLEVNIVDEGMETEFMYAEIEYRSVEEALAWKPEDAGMEDYLNDEVTNQPGQSMGAYWLLTRIKKTDN